MIFTGCALRCCYAKILRRRGVSQQGLGQAQLPPPGRNFFLELQQKGAANLNLVTATQWLPWVPPALDEARAAGPSPAGVEAHGGYETVGNRARAGRRGCLAGRRKYVSPTLAQGILGRAGLF